MRIVNAKCGSVIPIGRLGENDAVQVIFDVANWVTTYGNGTFNLLNKRNGDANAYPCDVIEDDGKLLWVINSADVANAGYGQCEIVYIVGDTIAKSEIYTTVVGKALTGGGDVPEPWEDWVQRVLEEGQRVKNFLDTLEGGTTGQVWTKEDDTAHWANPRGGGASSWDALTDKPFNTIGENLKVVNGALSVDTAPNVQQDNTKPITSAAVYTEVGNINALLALI